MTKLMNVDLECPKEFFIFCNPNNPTTVLNLKYAKTFTSGAFSNFPISNEFLKKYIEGTATYLPFLPTQDYDCKVFSEYRLSAINEYRIEYLAEVYRQRNFPKYPSRLSAVFAFGDYDSCIKADKKYHWDLSTVRKFKLIDSPYNRIIKANMEIISENFEKHR
jgi:hypothetical protein